MNEESDVNQPNRMFNFRFMKIYGNSKLLLFLNDAFLCFESQHTNDLLKDLLQAVHIQI